MDMQWEIITGVASSVIALCALVFSVWQGVEIRKHNRISCRPHLTTWVHKEHAQGIYGIDLINNGLGPALIKRFTVKVDGKKILGDETEPIDKALKILFPKEQFNARHAYLGEGYAMGAKDRCTVVIIQFHGEALPPPDYVEYTINRADLEVEYESFYGERFHFNSEIEKPSP